MPSIKRQYLQQPPKVTMVIQE